ncbi:MAG TPA: protein kinase [Gemmatimonadaceae bacterium]|nr:protein kinase [Gemmatimonadaceae bacterium]
MSDEVERLFEQALSRSPDARKAFLEETCPDDPQLREELLSLLDQVQPADQFFGRLNEAVFSSSFSTGTGEKSDAQPEESVLKPGDIVAQYRVVSLIGRGGMGTVYRSHDTRLDRNVALKFLPSYLGADADAQERLLSEARAVAALDHPNVCSIHEIGETSDGRLFIAMPCYDGETLKERLRRKQLPIEESVAIAIQIARGLEAAHTRLIVHRDVKPGNVMLASDGSVRLLDFGVAMLMRESIASSGITPGTVSYMSPEQARGDAIDARTDLWSLGVVLYEMLAGVRPFRGRDAREIREAILHDDVEPIATRRPGVPASLARIVERLLQKDPTHRYENAASVLTDLERWSSGASQRSSSRKRRSVLAASALLIVTIGVLGWRGIREERAFSRSAAGRAQPSIAVLPLKNLSSDSADAALATGMTEEIIATLANAGDVRVIASTSVSGFKGRQMDVRKIADSLGVSNVLEGGLQKSGSRVRLQVRLVNGNDGTTRWSQSYDREFKDIFAVQTDIAQAVASELELRFDKDRQLRRHNTRNLAAYELYLRGWDAVYLRSQSGLWKTQEYFQRAIEADSTYAAAHAGLALAYVRRAHNANDPGMPVPQLLALAEKEARTAIALDTTLAEGHYALARVEESMLHLPAAEAALRRSIALDANRSMYRRSLSYVFEWKGSPDEQLAEARRALENDPLNPYVIVAVADALYESHRYDEALAQFQRLATIKPPLEAASFGIAQIYAKKNMLPEAIATLRRGAEAGDPLYVALRGNLLARAGDREQAIRILADLIARRERTGSGAFHIAVVQAGLGNLDQAFIWLDKSVDDRTLDSFIMGPTFEELHRDPRFERLRKRLGLQKT